MGIPRMEKNIGGYMPYYYMLLLPYFIISPREVDWIWKGGDGVDVYADTVLSGCSLV